MNLMLSATLILLPFHRVLLPLALPAHFYYPHFGKSGLRLPPGVGFDDSGSPPPRLLAGPSILMMGDRRPEHASDNVTMYYLLFTPTLRISRAIVMMLSSPGTMIDDRQPEQQLLCKQLIYAVT